jgi:hypothetical protein
MVVGVTRSLEGFGGTREFSRDRWALFFFLQELDLELKLKLALAMLACAPAARARRWGRASFPMADTSAFM